MNKNFLKIGLLFFCTIISSCGSEINNYNNSKITQTENSIECIKKFIVIDKIYKDGKHEQVPQFVMTISGLKLALVDEYTNPEFILVIKDIVGDVINKNVEFDYFKNVEINDTIEIK